MDKSYANEMEAYLADAEHSYIQEADKRAFYMAVELWKKEAGPGRQGHKDFIVMAIPTISQLGLSKDTKAYMTLLECWPDANYVFAEKSPIYKQTTSQSTFFIEKFEWTSDANLCKHLLRTMERNGCPCTNEIYAKVTDLFGIYSDASVLARQQMLFNKRLMERNPFPIETPKDPTELAAATLRQASPGFDRQYHRFPIKQRDGSWVRSEKSGEFFESHDSVIVSQSPEQLNNLRNHNPEEPVLIEGPISIFMNGKATEIFVLRSENQVEKTAREKRNEKFDKKYTTVISNKEWFADFYGKDLETGMELHGGKQRTMRAFGAQGVMDQMDKSVLELEATHEKRLIFPKEEEPIYEQIEYDLSWKPIEDFSGDSIPELLKSGHLRSEEFADEVQLGRRTEAKVFCLAHIDCEQKLLPDAYSTWIRGIAETVEPKVQNFTVVLREDWTPEKSDHLTIDPSLGNRGYNQIEEVLESEQFDEELEEEIRREQIEREKAKENKKSFFTFFRKKKDD